MARFNGWRLTRAGIVFIIVAALLAVAVFAGLKYAQQRGEQVRRDQASEIARESQNEPTPVIAEEAPAPEAPASDAEQTPATTTPAENPAPAALPATGPASTIASISGIALVVYSAALYVTSRRSVSIRE